MRALEYKQWDGSAGEPRAQERAGPEARAEALTRLGFLLSAAQEPVDAAQYVVDAALQFFQWDASFLVLYNDETDRVNDLINVDTLQGGRQRVPAVLQDKPPSAMMRRVIEGGPQLVLREVARDPTHATVPFGDKARLSLSLMFVPVRLENKTIGVLSVQSYERGVYSEQDLEVLQGLADHAAGALGRLQAESELRESEERLRLAMECSGLGTWEYAQETDEFTYSETCATMFGLEGRRQVSFESFLGQLQAGEEGLNPAELLRNALVSGGELRLECRICRPDNTERWAILGAKRFLRSRNRLPPTAGLIGAVLDITQRKEAENGLREAQKELRAHARDLEETVQRRTARLQETVGELEHVSYALKHDMRAPLRAMQAYAQFAEEELRGVEAPAVMEYLRLVRVASHRLDRLVQDSLSYNRAVLSELTLHPVDLGSLLPGLLETYPQFQAGRAQIQLQKDLPVVLGNEAGLTQCFANLLDNAVKFVEPGQIPWIRVWAEQSGERVRVWVEDRGIGIPGNLRERIFEIFQRATSDYEGTGIGLSIVKKVIQRMGGTVGVESEEGRGSRFWVELKGATQTAHLR